MWDNLWTDFLATLLIIAILTYVVCFFIVRKEDNRFIFNDKAQVITGFYKSCAGTVKGYNYGHPITLTLNQVHCKDIALEQTVIKVAPFDLQKLP